MHFVQIIRIISSDLRLQSHPNEKISNYRWSKCILRLKKEQLANKSCKQVSQMPKTCAKTSVTNTNFVQKFCFTRKKETIRIYLLFHSMSKKKQLRSIHSGFHVLSVCGVYNRGKNIHR